MLNLIDGVRSNSTPHRLEIGDFLFTELVCGIGAERVALWTPTDYLVNVVTGRKTWYTQDGVLDARRGDSLFFKKGAAIVNQHFESEFCLLIFFIPDQLLRETVREVASTLGPTPVDVPAIVSATRVENDVALNAFFQSIRSYFDAPEKPSEALLRLKVKELIVSILTSGRNPQLAAYLRKLGELDAPSVAETMEANFRFNLSLEEYARLCHRSLSSFKREFQANFDETPGKWLLRKRLDYSASLLRNSKMNITEIAFESGFEDVSHFSRVFKAQFTESPAAFREKALAA